MSKVFRTQDNTPPYCVEASRDFQLFCRAMDVIANGVKFDIDSMIQVLDPMKVSDDMLELYATRVGFFHKKPIDSNVLRYIISAFPYIIKNKGTLKGIKQSAYTILKAENSVKLPYPVVQNKVEGIDRYIIAIYFPTKILNKYALKELLSYVVPAGYKIQISVWDELRGAETKTKQLDTLTTIQVPTYIDGAVRGSNGIGGEYYNGIPTYTPSGSGITNPTNEEKSLINAFDMVEIVGSSNYDTKETKIKQTQSSEESTSSGGGNT